MSLNRNEQVVFDYLQGHAEERQYWQDKVRRLAANSSDLHTVAAQLDGDLRRYCAERSAVAVPFREMAVAGGLGRVSMRNLAEYLIRLWTPQRTSRPVAPSPHQRV